jgi:hypothetical protein
MASQSATNVLAACKREAVFGTEEASGAGADRIRILDSPGLKLNRANIASNERRSDQLMNIGRLGGKTVTGSYTTEINPGGEFDLFLEDLVRGTIGSLQEETTIDNGGVGVGTQVAKVATPATPIYRSYTIEQYDTDIDQSETFIGCRLVSGAFSFQPGEMATCEWGFQGVDRNVKTTGQSPWYTSPTLTSGVPLIADDAVITYGGSAITTLTGVNLTVSTEAAGQPVIGSFVSPDIFMNMLTVSGDITAIREDLTALDAFDAETEFELKVVLQAPTAAPKLTFAFVCPRIKIMDIDAAFSGGDAAKVETRQFMGYAPAGQNNAIDFYTSTETPTLVT